MQEQSCPIQFVNHLLREAPEVAQNSTVLLLPGRCDMLPGSSRPRWPRWSRPAPAGSPSHPPPPSASTSARSEQGPGCFSARRHWTFMAEHFMWSYGCSTCVGLGSVLIMRNLEKFYLKDHCPLSESKACARPKLSLSRRDQSPNNNRMMITIVIGLTLRQEKLSSKFWPHWCKSGSCPWKGVYSSHQTKFKGPSRPET